MGQKLLKVFEIDWGRIRNIDARAVVIALLNQGSDDFLKWQSSSTGKYHPPDEIAEIGMALHVKRCAALAPDASRMYELDPIQSDAVLAGCLIHDLWKRGKNNNAAHTDARHMIIAYHKVNDMGDTPFISYLADACLFHEGVWTPPEAKALGISDPTKVAHALHFIDMAVSRRMTYTIMQPEWVAKVADIVARAEQE